MTQEEAFMRAIVQNPDDNTQRLIYADWLDEHNDLRGKYLRLLPVLDGRRSGMTQAEALARLRELQQRIDPAWSELMGHLELIRRRPLWESLGDLFIDNELSEGNFRWIAESVLKSGYSPLEVRAILWYEVFPRIEVNLRHPAGEWIGFRADWLQEVILSPPNKNTATEQPQTAAIIRDTWVNVCRFLPEEFRICGTPI